MRAPSTWPGSGLTAKLRDELVYLDRSRRADGMAFRQQSARRVDRQAATQRRLATFGDRAAIAHVTEAQIFDLLQLAERRRVVHFGHVDLSRPKPRLLESPVRRDPTHRESSIIQGVGNAGRHLAGHDRDSSALVEARQRTV